MIDEIVRCETCNSIVELGRNPGGRLLLTCDCGETRSVKVKKAFPEGWI